MTSCDTYEFISNNSAFVLTLIGILGAGLSGIAMCVLKSRCSTIKCCCVSCERQVLSERAVTELAAVTALRRVRHSRSASVAYTSASAMDRRRLANAKFQLPN